ncbi:MAG: CehA/McbA family metallohydrolase [Planctomycetota bacterium]|jgi:hypothetical protein
MSSKWALLHVTVRDAVTKGLVAARIHVKRADGGCFLPPAESDRRFSRTRAPDVILPEHFRAKLHVCRQNDIRSIHLARGEATFPVPAERLVLWVARGHEYGAVRRVFAATVGETSHVEVDLHRVESLSRAGWMSGDMHVHFSRFKAEDDYILAALMAAEDLPAVNNMVFKAAGKVEAPQRKMGHAGSHYRLHHDHQIVAGGEEFRDDDLYGHMIAAGISRVIEPVSVGPQLGRRENYPLFAQVCDWTHDQGGIAGWAHGGALIKLHESLPVEAALGKLDFIESIQFNSFVGFYFWYRLLNCGLRLAVTGGSDFPFSPDILAPWYPNLGLDRTYVRVGAARPFTYDAYIGGIRRGRTFATNGPLLLLTVDGKGPGARVRLDAGARRVEVIARAVCQHPLDRLEIVVNGAVEKIVDGKGGPREIACRTRLRLSQSSWIAARVRGRVSPETYGGVAPWNLHAHTSPVYVLIGKRRILQRADATAMADYVRLIREAYRRKGSFGNDRQRQVLAAALVKAETFYERLLRTQQV